MQPPRRLWPAVCSDRRRRVEVVADVVPPVSTPCTMTSSMCDPTSVSHAAIYLHLADRAAIDRNVAASRRAGEMELGEQLEQEELVPRRQHPPWSNLHFPGHVPRPWPPEDRLRIAWNRALRPLVPAVCPLPRTLEEASSRPHTPASRASAHRPRHARIRASRATRGDPRSSNRSMPSTSRRLVSTGCLGTSPAPPRAFPIWARFRDWDYHWPYNHHRRPC